MVLKYEAALPAPVMEHWRNYWESWLMPDRPYEGFEYEGKEYDFAQGYIGLPQATEYLEETGDWRGNFSVYRTYVRDQGTMNFNHWSTAAVLLGGQSIDSPEMMAEGRAGLENFVQKLWSWADGSTQESVDHYYFGHSLRSQKVFVDFGPSAHDRLVGRTILAKSIEELAANFHPHLNRFTASSGRTGIAYVLGTQDGTQFIMNTLSPETVLTDIEKETITAPNVKDLEVIGHDLPPGDVATQTLNGPWAPEWFSNILQNKPLPFEFTASYRPGIKKWRRSYLGENYGLASLDINAEMTVPILGQWRRAASEVKSMTELGTMLIRGGANHTEMLDTQMHGTEQRNPNGIVGAQGHQLVALQDKNRAIVLTSPIPGLANDESGRAEVGDVTSLQTTVGLFNFEESPTWSIYVDGEKIESLPAKAKFGSKITIHDGVSYVGLIPIPATDLGRGKAEVEITDSGRMTILQGGGEAREAVRIDAYVYKSDKPIDKARADLDDAYSGYVVELGDEKEYGSFEKFQEHIAATKLAAKWDQAKKTVEVAYKTGDDTLELSYVPGSTDGDPEKFMPVRTVNGEWPYLPSGMDRDDPYAQMGRTGKLEKNGLTLETEPGRMAYVLTEPVSGHFVAFNPFSDPTLWKLTLPGGAVVTANGRLAMTRMEFDQNANVLTVDYGDTAGADKQGDLASALVIQGDAPTPKMIFNGQEVVPQQGTLDGKKSSAFPIDPAFDAKKLEERWKGAQGAFARVGEEFDPAKTQIVDWWFVGPMTEDQLAESPEAAAGDVDLGERYATTDGDGEWTTVTGAAFGETGAITMGSRFEGSPTPEGAYVFATTLVDSAVDQDVLVTTGANAALAVWVNGEMVTEYETNGTAYPDMNRAYVKLKKGPNVILTRTRKGNGWEFYLRLADRYGQPLDNITVDLPQRG